MICPRCQRPFLPVLRERVCPDCKLRVRGRRTVRMIGLRFGDLTVKAEHVRWAHRRRTKFYVCHCKCGAVCVVDGAALRSGNTRSCGHRRRWTSQMKTARQPRDERGRWL